MASTTATLSLDPGGEGPAEVFHLFPDLPPELRVPIWQMAYDALPNTLVYRFRLEFSHVQETDEDTKPRAFIVPLKEVGYLTSELRSLRRANAESRVEGDRFFGGGCLRFNQTEKGDATDICTPINLPWRSACDLFCFVGLTEGHVASLHQADTSLIDHVFDTVQSLGLGLDRTLEGGINYFDDFADFILLFSELRHASLVSDLLMSEADLDDISDEIRADYLLASWSDWNGRVPEEVFASDCEDATIVTKDQHLEAIGDFTDAMFYRGDTGPDPEEALLRLSYGMIFRTEECLDFLLWDIDVLDQLAEEYGLLDGFSDEFNGEFSDEYLSEENEDI